MDVNTSDDECRLRIAQINVRKLIDITTYIEWSKAAGADILVCTEYAYKESCSRNEETFVLESKESRVAIIKLTGKAQLRCPHVSTHHVVVKVKPIGFMLHGWYIPPDRRNRGEAATNAEAELLECLSRQKSKTIHTGDLNSRSTGMGDSLTDVRGGKVIEAAANGGYVAVNAHGVHTHRNERHNNDGEGDVTGKSIVDWTLCSVDLAEQVTWEAHPARFGSDHEFILVTVTGRSSNTQQERRTGISPAKFLRSITTQIRQDDDVSNWHDKYSKAVEDARTTVNSKRKAPLPEEVKRLKAQVDSLAKTIKRSGGTLERLRPELKKLSTEYREKRKQAVEAHKLEVLKDETKRVSAMDIVDRMKTTTKLSYLQAENAQLRGAEAGKRLLEKCFPENEEETLVIDESRLGPDDPAITDAEIRKALDSFEVNKAPGRSGVNFALLRQWYAKMPVYFNKLFNDWLEKRCFPDEMKESAIVFLLKNRSAASTLDNVRPISLMECIGRWFEKIIDNRLMFHVERRGLLSDIQHGYRAGKSAVDALEKLHQARATNSKDKEVIVQTDVKAAFDSLRHTAMVRTLHEMKLPKNIVQVIVSYLKNRKVSASLNDEWVTRPMLRGAPQGSSLGPHLYILSTTRMLEKVKQVMREINAKAEVISYADDVVMAVAASTHQEALQAAGGLVETINEQLEQVGLSLAKKKTKVMLTDKLEQTLEVQIAGESVQTVNQMKILGVNFCHSRRYGRHVDQVLDKTEKWLSANQRIMGYRSPATVEQKKELVNTVLIPKLTYGAEVWYKVQHQNPPKLRRATRMIARQVISAPYTAGFTAVTMLARMLPLPMYCKMKVKLAQCKNKGVRGGKQIEQRLLPHELGHPAERRAIEFGGTLWNDEQINAVEAEVKIFTDGSKFEEEETGRTGAAAVIRQQGRPTIGLKMKLDAGNSVYQAELTAIIGALQHVMTRNDARSFAIFTDSLSALKAMGGHRSLDRLVDKCRELHKQITESGKSIEFYHCKAHAGISGNELADNLAKEATTQGSECIIPQPWSTVKRQLKEEAWKDFDEYVKKDEYGRTIKTFFDGPLDERLDKVIINWLTSEIYTGHGDNRESMRFGYAGSGQDCPCGEKQTMQHLLQTCPLVMSENIRIARQAGISDSEYLVEWDQLTRHKNFHTYINLRAKGLKEQLRGINRHILETKEMDDMMYKLTLSTTKERAEIRRRLSTHPKNNWFRVCEPEADKASGETGCREHLTYSQDGLTWSLTHGFHVGEVDYPDTLTRRSNATNDASNGERSEQ